MHKHMRKTIRSPGRGFSLVWTIVCITVLMTFVSLAVDLGRVQCAKTELYRAADAAARYAATGISDGTSATKAIAAAADNNVDGSPLVLTSNDVVPGTWSNGTFTAGGASPNAVKITASRTSARGNAIPLTFARMIGTVGCDISTTVVVMATTPPASY